MTQNTESPETPGGFRPTVSTQLGHLRLTRNQTPKVARCHHVLTRHQTSKQNMHMSDRQVQALGQKSTKSASPLSMDP
jgi:hypothetical protein